MFVQTGCTGSFWPISIESCIVRAADEGIPVGAIKRSFCTAEIDVDVRELITEAVISGRIVEKPPEDWPVILPRHMRAGATTHYEASEDDDTLIIKMARAIKTTEQESRVLMVLLRRGQTTREMLHDAVEANRGNPDDATDIKIVDVIICKIRKKLEVFGFPKPNRGIYTAHSIGYDMTDVDREKVWSIIRGK